MDRSVMPNQVYATRAHKPALLKRFQRFDAQPVIFLEPGDAIGFSTKYYADTSAMVP